MAMYRSILSGEDDMSQLNMMSPFNEDPYCIPCKKAGIDHEITKRPLSSQEHNRLRSPDRCLTWHIYTCTGCESESQPMTHTDLGM